ncbi:hypothetical protein OROHE_003288 [Orobanche hederae]
MSSSELWEARISGGESVHFYPDIDDEYIQISSVALGSPGAIRCPRFLPIRLCVDGKKSVIGTLTPKSPQILMKLKVATQFKLCHECNGLDVYVRGHSAKMAVVPDYYSESEDEEAPEFEFEDEETPSEMSEDEEIPKKTPPGEETPPEMYESNFEETPHQSEDEDTPPEITEDKDTLLNMKMRRHLLR